MILAGAGIKLAAASGVLAGGVAVVTGAASGGSHLNDLTHQPDTATTICDYATDPGPDPHIAEDTRTTHRLRLDAAQAANARVIIHTATEQHLPTRAAVIAIATALQESDLGRDLTGDHGTSFGLFHQKPTSGYGTRTQILNPHHAARAFYSRLTHLDDWQRLPLTQAAQAVQKSATPTAYAHHEPRATKIVRTHGTATPHLTASTKNEIRAGLITTAASKLPRAKALAQITRTLHGAPHPPSTDDITKQFQADADKLCTQLVKDTSGQPSVPGGSGRGVLAIRAAMTQLGVPYSWGGGGPSGPGTGIAQGAHTVGYDCSSLAQYAWAKAGVPITRTTDTQWHDGPHIPRTQLQPGDLIFFANNPGNPATIHHVGLNIDGNRMIHAPQTGRTVEITRWRGNSYYENQYAGAVRPAAGRQ
ncbi:C40 family peptidase [Actinomadura oligospora]|uniref:C40 family peptidase n=1 Tax=Actinomadura oligospora TaxID=111804 RepID=UPI0004B45351|nr:C40 family peptidase [Actinomadura oligospora]